MFKLYIWRRWYAGGVSRHHPDGTFRVNASIRCRPSVRHGNQRNPPPAFNFPVTPPGTAGLLAVDQGKASPSTTPNPASTQWSGTPKQSPALGGKSKFAELRNLARPARHRRAMSDSTIHDAATSRGEVEPSKPSTPIPDDRNTNRPRTMDDLAAFTTPVLNINIPSWRIGTPRFTLRGTPIIRGSSYAPTEDFRSSNASMLNRLPRESSNGPMDLGRARQPPPSLSFQGSKSPRHHSVAPPVPSPRMLKAMRSTYMSQVAIQPDMFTDLTFTPACDDRSIVRYASNSRSVTAATPPRLVAEITSPSFLDYELISDFFLTYRSFLEPIDLTRMLFARMRWALTRQDEYGMIVRVRTFVAIRHWILNYFMDDFVLDYELRCIFCQLLNDTVQNLSTDSQIRRVQLKVIIELKKCWRRICAHYWDGPDFEEALSVEVPLVPGGIAGNRDPNLDPSAWDGQEFQPSQFSPALPPNPHGETSTIGEATRPAHISDFVVFGNRPVTPENKTRADDFGVESPMSTASLDVLSCTFPSKAMKNVTSNPSQSLAVHPVQSTLPLNNPAAVATTPKALVGKRVRPAHSHKRSNSMSDSLREHLSEKRPSNEHEGLPSVPSAGSLVRGNIMPPGHAFVDLSGPHKGLTHRQTTVFQPQGRKMFFKDRTFASAMSASGMKKLLGSFRRALSNRGQPTSPTQANIIHFTPVGPSGASPQQVPGMVIMPQDQLRHNGARPVVRIDLLGAEVAEDFKSAVREEETAAAALEAGRRSVSVSDMSMSIKIGFVFDPAGQQNQMPLQSPQNLPPRPAGETGVATDAQQNVVDPDLLLPQADQTQRGVSGAPSVDSFTEAFMPTGGDPTPPNTPPAHLSRDVPRRSSYLINQHVLNPTSYDDEAPPVPLIPTTSANQSSVVSRDFSRPSLSVYRHSQYASVSSSAFRMHRRNKSSRTQSMSSLAQTAYSGELLPMTTFDPRAPSQLIKKGIVLDEPADPMPEPLRVLRRRPGGDLKAATNVNDLQHRLLRRSQSVGSFATYTDSMRSSWVVSPDPDPEARYKASQELSALARMAKGPGAHTHGEPSRSSKPPLRASFEAQAQRLAQISDDEDDGGIESALRKLEGRYDDKPRSNRNSNNEDDDEVDIFKLGQALQNLGGPPPEPVESHQDEVTSELGGARTPREPQTKVQEVSSFLSGVSHDSRSSIPLLERDDESNYTFGNGHWTDRSVYRDDDASTVPEQADGRHSFDVVEKTDSLEQIKPGSTQPNETEDQSFLEDESVADTDLSSELSEEDAERETLGEHGGYFSDPELPTNPLGDSFVEHASPTSPSQATPRQPMSPKVDTFPKHSQFSRPTLPTPDATPTAPSTQTMPPTSQLVPSPLESPRKAPQPDPNVRKFSVHLPFILAFESEVLAQQFTLIEKDALNEIDWKDLIDMNWKNTASSSSRSWVDFLRNSEAHGVEVVIARFNIMVKWAISEIVLTQHIEERARCIIKMIHIAAHCRRYRNFATLAQLTIALTSNEVGRLGKTWDMVPSHDLKTLGALEALVTPTRNFFNLRAEMEVGTDTGCIPFVGIYTHDLLYNAQRPSEIASSPTTAPLVNFERCRIAASVIKVLLRLLESSVHYNFQPVEGITERCLWVGALSDDDIRQHSNSLE